LNNAATNPFPSSEQSEDLEILEISGCLAHPRLCDLIGNGAPRLPIQKFHAISIKFQSSDVFSLKSYGLKWIEVEIPCGSLSGRGGGACSMASGTSEPHNWSSLDIIRID
jgi:hypothetical protein